MTTTKETLGTCIASIGAILAILWFCLIISGSVIIGQGVSAEYLCENKTICSKNCNPKFILTAGCNTLADIVMYNGPTFCVSKIDIDGKAICFDVTEKAHYQQYAGMIQLCIMAGLTFISPILFIAGLCMRK